MATLSRKKRELYRRESRDIPVVVVFFKEDVILVLNKIIREEEEQVEKALRVVEAIKLVEQEERLFVSSPKRDFTIHDNKEGRDTPLIDQQL